MARPARDSTCARDPDQTISPSSWLSVGHRYLSVIGICRSSVPCERRLPAIPASTRSLVPRRAGGTPRRTRAGGGREGRRGLEGDCTGDAEDDRVLVSQRDYTRKEKFPLLWRQSPHGRQPRRPWCVSHGCRFPLPCKSLRARLVKKWQSRRIGRESGIFILFFNLFFIRRMLRWRDYTTERSLRARLPRDRVIFFCLLRPVFHPGSCSYTSLCKGKSSVGAACCWKGLSRLGSPKLGRRVGSVLEFLDGFRCVSREGLPCKGAHDSEILVASTTEFVTRSETVTVSIDRLETPPIFLANN